MSLEETHSEAVSTEMQFLMLAKDQTEDLEKQAMRLRELGIDNVYVDRLLTHMLNHLRLYEKHCHSLAEENATLWDARIKNLQFLEGLTEKKE